MAGRRLLEYRAGGRARRLIRERGLDAERIGGLWGPASGPKWLVLAGVDRALIESGMLRRAGQSGRLLLAGASAGAWRMLAMACRDPLAGHRAFEAAYVGMVFGRGVTAAGISGAYRRMLAGLFPGDEVRHILDHPFADVALHVVRARGLAGSPRPRLQALAMAAAAGMNALSARTMGLLFERLLVHSAPQRWRGEFRGRVLPLTADGFAAAALASGTVPLYMAPVEDVSGAGPGRFLDGGLTDYHLDQSYPTGDGRVLLFPHFQERIAPNWFDRYLPWRRPAGAVLDNVLQLYPSQEFVAGLPGGRIPTRDDFIELVDDPELRIRRWQEASALGDRLGEQLLKDLERGRIPDLVQPI